MTTAAAAVPHHRIGLALSGGGFRASLFHLGVIRRLEELRIMERVAIVSAVSGGSIVAAFYLCEMEKELREVLRRGQTPDRVALFEKIATKFMKAVEHNLRTRALIYSPRYHPIRFLKAAALQAFRPGARADLIQAEYDKFFFFNDTMDQLPVVKSEEPEGGYSACIDTGEEPLYGPKLLLNTTSLLSGERVPFSRDTSSGIKDLKTSDKNVLLLSRVVGASSGVPVVFPPTSIAGDLLVDGGVSDNQGVEGLLDPASGINVMLVSDASGQMQIKHSLSISSLSVYTRTNDIFQFQIRNKLLDRLCTWGETRGNSFAFIHLLVNLKNRYGKPPRVSTEFLPALSRIRTDLDQFSPIECESLMYHGYTLIDAQINQYCCDFLHAHLERRLQLEQSPPMRVPPLFKPQVQQKLRQMSKGNENSWDPIRADLEAGSQSLYWLRCLKKHTLTTSAATLVGAAFAVFLLWLAFGLGHGALDIATRQVEKFIFGLVPESGIKLFDQIIAVFGIHQGLGALIDIVSQIVAFLAIVSLAGYIAYYPVYEMIRGMSMSLDLSNYKKTTGSSYTLHWSVSEEDGGHEPQ